MADDPITSKCTIRLLAIASEAAYGVAKDDRITDEAYSEDLQTIDDHGYTVTKSIAPQRSQGTGTSPLAAVCLEPKDAKSPIIIAFRGTSTMGDVVSDLRLGIKGVVEEKFRHAAFDFYQKVREEHPNREIILTGHSLGGHIAQYVATRGYNTAPNKLSSTIQVRTFNTAPVSTSHKKIFQQNQEVYSQFVNYRLSPDVISSLPLQKYTGNTFVFPCQKNWLKAHFISSVINDLPKEVLDQPVGTTDLNKKHNMLIELTQGLLHSYQCRVQGQYFSRLRAGTKNLQVLQRELPKILEKMKTGNKDDFDDAYTQLADLKNHLKGNKSNHIIDVLMKSTKAVKLNELVRTAKLDGSTTQKEIKDQLTALRSSGSEASLTSEEISTPSALQHP